MTKIFKEYKTRIAWLSLGLLLSLLIAGTVHYFEKVLQENILIAAFIPLVVYVSDAVGTQMESIIIRALNKNLEFSIGKFFSEQILITVLVGITLSILTFIFVLIFFDGVRLALTISLGLFGGVMSSLFSGTLIPYYFWKFHQDPAEASGPIATVVQDFVSVFIFFFIASLIL